MIETTKVKGSKQANSIKVRFFFKVLVQSADSAGAGDDRECWRWYKYTLAAVILVVGILTSGDGPEVF